jgi:hypothetical protein
MVEGYRKKQKMTKQQLITSCALGLHFICGVIYYVAKLLNTGVNVN